ncbi:glycosyltransferase [Neobacillus pocheonensis]|uniref:glycosyltransferase n=1 Tax=Neobacillus pocheonensis TaxID=363869 RepID=UPI003D2C1E1F
MLGNSLYEGLLTNLKNSFTYEFWVKPDILHPINKQSRKKPVNPDGQNYINGPGHVKYYDEAAVHVSVGKNGITVYEHTDINIYAVLVYEEVIKKEAHIAVIYDDGRPYLYMNGAFVKSGERSPKRNVYPAGIFGEQPGLYFEGDIKEIRLWDHCRSEKQLQTDRNKQLKGNEEGLFGSWTARRDVESEVISKKKSNRQNRTNKKNQDIEVSIIIPSFNKFPLNLFTLYSLENQTFNPAKMEVIFIDDASTDQTEEKLKNYHPPYQFNYIRNEKNLGRAKVRNVGIRSARGSLLIFLDAEMVTEPDFVEKHYRYHQSKNKMILSGVMHSKKIYTCIFPEFSQDVRDKITDLTTTNQEINRRLRDFQLPSENPYPLVEKNDITSLSYKDLVFKSFSWFQKITKNFDADLNGFMFPWMALLTGNVSIRKEFIEQAGMFDEDFIQYGYEDWELGYRLYKMGAKYLVRNDVTTYHQEHPVGQDKWKEAIHNLRLFINKHPDVDVLILGLELARIADLITISKVLKEYKLLLKSYPERFQGFQEKFIRILETIVLLLQIDIRHVNILGAAGIGSEGRIELQEDLLSIKNLDSFTNLASIMEKLMNT